MLNNIVLLRKIQINYCRIPESPYICTVFFIVLDLRLTKVGARRCSFFYAHIPRSSLIWAQFENLGELVKNTIFVA